MSASTQSMEQILSSSNGQNTDDLAQQFAGVLNKQKEMAAARKTYDAKSTASTGELLDLQIQQSQVQKVSAQQSTQTLTNIKSDLTKSAAIDNSFLSQLIEPFAETFSVTDGSRKLLQKRIANSSQQLAIDQQQNTLAAQAVKNKATEINLQLKAEQAKFASITGDFTDQAQAMATQQMAVNSITKSRAVAVSNANDKDLQGMVTSGIATQHTIDTETRNRRNDTINAQTAEAGLYLNTLRMQEAQLGEMTPEQLLSPNTAGKYGPEATRRAYQSKIQQDMAFQNAEIVNKQAQAAEAQRTLTDAQLTKNPSASGNTAYSAKEALKDRESKNAASADDMNKRLSSIGDSYLVNSSWDQLDKLHTEASSPGKNGKPEGIAIAKDADGRQLTFPLEKIRAQLNLKSAAQGEQAQVANAVESTKIAMLGVSQNIARMNGVNLPDGVTVEDFLNTQIKDAQLPPQERAAFNDIKGQMLAAQDPNAITDPINSMAIVKKANESLIALQNVREKRELAMVPADSQPGTKQFFDTGRINSNINAIPIISSHTMARDAIDSAPYKQAMDTLYGVTFNQTNQKQAAADLLAQIGRKKLAPEDMLRERVTHPDTQAAMATPILLEGLRQAHIDTAQVLGLPQLAASIQSGDLFSNNQFDEKPIAAWLKDNTQGKITLEGYIAAMTKSVSTVADRLYANTGKYATLKASLNQLLFNSDLGTYLQEYAVQGIQSGWRRSTSDAQISTQLSPTMPLAVPTGAL